MPRITLNFIKREVERIDLGVKPEDDEYKIAVVLLSSLRVGPNIKRLAKYTKYPRSIIAEFSKNLRKSGIWRGGKICHSGWFDEDGSGGIAFILDCSAGLGLIERS